MWLRLLLPRRGRRAELRRLGLSTERDLHWDGCVNARDLGGLPTADGRVTRRGALVRSEAVDRLSPAGWEALRAHGVRTIIDLRNDDERVGPIAVPADVRVIHISLDRLDEDPEFWVDWMNGPQFATPLYYRPFMERFPDRIDAVLDAIAALTVAGVAPDAIADDYALAAERARTHDPALEEFLAEKGTSARELVIELAANMDLDRPGLRARLVV
ncbi:MAG: tyrosine-protein phosphatase [Candidatus Limnocylindria bacterium]